jgi:hypothetical protein|tara:strand:- start:161 stop:364 length:204 start_codon:yes stop_codon:yes gene_type:complete
MCVKSVRIHIKFFIVANGNYFIKDGYLSVEIVGKKLGGYITKHLNMEVTQIFLLGFLMLKKLAKIFG